MRASSVQRVVFLFIDGVGVGSKSSAINPLAHGHFLLSQFNDGSGTPLPRKGRRIDVDATFGVPGRPQSATNQTALLTGMAAPRLIQRHVLGYPNRALAELLATASIVRRLLAAGRTAAFANAYPVGYLDALGLPRRQGRIGAFEMPPALKRRLKPSASTLAFAAAGVPLRTIDDSEAGVALTHDIDGSSKRQRSFNVPRRTPEQAAAIVWALPEAFVFFEHYLADEAGHAQDAGAAESALVTFDRFAREVVRLKPDDAQVIVCSDHGNVEDLSTRNHTTNPVAVLSFGRGELGTLETVADVGLQVLRWLEVE